jgi:hypothetical protein
VAKPPGGGWLERLERLDRRYLFVALAAAIVVPLLVPVPLPLAVTPMARDLYDAIERLPERSIVLVSADYDPSGKPELAPFHVALMRHLARKHLRVVIVSLWAPGPPLTEQVLAQVGYETTLHQKRGVDFVHLGFKEGRQIVMKAMGQSLRQTFPKDHSGTPVEQIPLMREVDSYGDFALLIDISAGNPGVKEYVQVVQSRYRVKMVGACTAVSGPDYVPYYRAGQLLGLAAGMKGAAEYEKLVGYPGAATTGMAAQSASHVLLVAFIVFGNVMYFRARRRGDS